MIPIGESTGSSMWSFVIALFILVWLPSMVERKTDKKEIQRRVMEMLERYLPEARQLARGEGRGLVAEAEVRV